MPSLREYDDIFRSQESDAGEALDRIRREQVAMRLQPDEDPELARRNIESRHAVLSPRYQALEGTLRQQGEQARIESFPQVEDVPVFKHLLSPFVDKEPAGTRKPYSPDELAARATNKQRLMESLASPTQAPDIPEDVRAQIVHSIQVGHPQVPEEYAQHVPEDLRSQVERGAIEPIEAVNPFEAPTRPLRGLAYTPLKLGAAAAGTAVGGPVVGLGAYGEAEKRLQALDPEGNKWEPVGALTRAGLGGVSGIVQGDKTLGEIIEGAKNAMTETGKQPASFEELFAEAGYDPAVGKVLSFATEMGLQAAPLHEILSRAGLQGQAERKLTAPERVRKLQATRTGEAPRPLPDEPALTPRADREKPSQRLGRGTIAETAQETLQRLSERAQNAPPGSEARLTAQEQLQQLERAKEARNPSQGFGPDTVGAARKKGSSDEDLSREIARLRAKEDEIRRQRKTGGVFKNDQEALRALSKVVKERARLEDQVQATKLEREAVEQPQASPQESASDYEQLAPGKASSRFSMERDRERLANIKRLEEQIRRDKDDAEQQAALQASEAAPSEEPASPERARQEYEHAVEYRKSIENDALRGDATRSDIAEARRSERKAKQALDRIREPQVPPPAPTPQEPNLPSAEQAPQEAPLEAPSRVRVVPEEAWTGEDMGMLARHFDRQRREEMLQAQTTAQAETQRPATAEEALNRLREGAAQEPMQPGAQEGIGLPGETTERRRLEVPPPTATPTKGRVHEDLLATARPTYRIGQGAPSQIEFIDPADKVIYTVTNRGAKSKTHDSSLAALKKAGYTDAEIAARGKEIRANLKKQYAADPGSDLRIGERPQQGTPAASEPQPMTPQEILRQFNEEEVARRAEIERQAVPPPPKRPGPVPSPQARGESPTAAPTGVSPAAPPGFGQGGKKRAKGAPPIGGTGGGPPPVPPVPPPNAAAKLAAITARTPEQTLWEKTRAWVSKAKEGFVSRFLPAHWLPKDGRDILRRGEANMSQASDQIADEMYRILKPRDNDRPLTFAESESLNELLILRDFKARYVQAKAAGNAGFKLPEGLTEAEVNQELGRLQNVASKNPLLAEAAGRSKDMMERVADDLEFRGKLNPANRRDAYFPHIVKDFLNDQGVSLEPGEWSRLTRRSRGYMKGALGSERPILGNFLEGITKHLSRVFRDNALDDMIDEVTTKYGKDAEIAEIQFLNKAGVTNRKDYFKRHGVTFEEDYAEHLKDQGLKLYTPLKSYHRLVDAFSGQERIALESALRAAYAGKPAELQYALGKVEGAKLVGRIGETYLLPEKIAKGLEEYWTEKKDQLFLDAGHTANRWMKAGLTSLQGPSFQVTNMLGDLLNMYGEDVRSLAYIPEAMRIIKQQYKWEMNGEGAPHPMFQEARKGGVTQSGLHAGQVGQLFKDPRFLDFASPDTPKWNAVKRAGGKFEKLWTLGGAYREDIGRLAMYLRKKAAGMSVEEAAKVAREFSVDYQKLTPFERTWMNGLLVPFYSWTKQNTWNWMQRAVGGRGQGIAGPIKILAPLIGLYLWNNSAGNKETEDSLPKYIREQFHIITGMKQPDGKPIVLTTQMPVDELFKMIGMGNPVGRVVDAVNRKDWSQLSKQLKESLWGIGKFAGERLSPLLMEPVEQIANEDFRFGMPIVEKRQENLPWTEQRREGDVLPTRLQHVAEKFFSPLRKVRSVLATPKGGRTTRALKEGLGLPFVTVDPQKERQRLYADNLSEIGRPYNEQKARQSEAVDRALDMLMQGDMDEARARLKEGRSAFPPGPDGDELYKQMFKDQFNARKGGPLKRAFNEIPEAGRVPVVKEFIDRRRSGTLSR